MRSSRHHVLDRSEHLLDQARSWLRVEVLDGRVAPEGLLGRGEPRPRLVRPSIEGLDRLMVDVIDPPEPVRLGRAEVAATPAALQRAIRSTEDAGKHFLRKPERAAERVEGFVG